MQLCCCFFLLLLSAISVRIRDFDRLIRNLPEFKDFKGFSDAEVGKSFVDYKGVLLSIVEMNCETDFVAKNADFHRACDLAAEMNIFNKEPEPDTMLALINKFGENIRIRRRKLLHLNGVFGLYLHNRFVTENDRRSECGTAVVVVSLRPRSGGADLDLRTVAQNLA